MKSLRKAVVGEGIGDNNESVVDMFELEEIKEIADYLIVYYETRHIKTEIKAAARNKYGR